LAVRPWTAPWTVVGAGGLEYDGSIMRVVGALTFPLRLALSWILLMPPAAGVGVGRAFAKQPRPSSAEIAARIRDPGCQTMHPR
jgi:hypothetical protein